MFKMHLLTQLQFHDGYPKETFMTTSCDDQALNFTTSLDHGY